MESGPDEGTDEGGEEGRVFPIKGDSQDNKEIKSTIHVS